jgi:Mn2+/Fe2+ NRAMP family transporter
MNDVSSDAPQDVAQVSPERVHHDRDLIIQARQQGTGSLLRVFTKLSGPGWLQSAITLGGGSLAGSLYLGVLAGYNMMWVQALAMILGVIMLSAIGFVTLSTGKRPFAAINQHVSPVLGWGWAIATMMANLVWCMPQFALGKAAMTQNLSPEGLGSLPPFQQNLVCAAVLLAVGTIMIWFYDSGGWGIRVFEWILKGMVAIVVISFFGVVLKMTLSSEGLDWGEIGGGFLPDLSLLTKPTPVLQEIIGRTGEFADFWTKRVVTDQQQVMITAAATAVGINMTFLLPYSMLSKGWDREFRGLAIFDLSTGLFIPFILATGCVVIAAASQFHGRAEAGLVELYSDSSEAQPAANLISDYEKQLDDRIAAEVGADEMAALKADPDALRARRAALPESDRQVAATLVKRDAFNLANSLQRLVGKGTAQYVFGVGVLGMAVSTIIILMLINGFVVCEMLGLPPKGMAHRAGCLLAGLVGATGPFLWSQAAVYLAVPTSMFGMVLLPIAYWTFFFMLNNRGLMGAEKPTGARLLWWNVLMIIAAGMATFGSFWSIKTSKYPMLGFAGLGAFVLLALVVHFMRQPASPSES